MLRDTSPFKATPLFTKLQEGITAAIVTKSTASITTPIQKMSLRSD